MVCSLFQMSLPWKQTKNSCPPFLHKAFRWDMLRWSCWIPAGTERYPSVPVVRFVCPFLVSTKVNRNNYMIPKTNPVDSSWWETRKFVSGWFDITANLKKAGGGWWCLGILIPSNLSVILCLTFLWYFIVSLNSMAVKTIQYDIMQYILSLYTYVPRNTSLETVMWETCSVWQKERFGWWPLLIF